jgi:hypothetical protein
VVATVEPEAEMMNCPIEVAQAFALAVAFAWPGGALQREKVSPPSQSLHQHEA